MAVPKQLFIISEVMIKHQIMAFSTVYLEYSLVGLVDLQHMLILFHLIKNSQLIVQASPLTFRMLVPDFSGLVVIAQGV